MRPASEPGTFERVFEQPRVNPLAEGRVNPWGQRS